MHVCTYATVWFGNHSDPLKRPLTLILQGYTDSEVSRFLLEADPDASGRITLPAFLTAAPAIFGGLDNFEGAGISPPASPANAGGWSSQVLMPLTTQAFIQSVFSGLLALVPV